MGGFIFLKPKFNLRIIAISILLLFFLGSRSTFFIVLFVLILKYRQNLLRYWFFFPLLFIGSSLINSLFNRLILSKSYYSTQELSPLDEINFALEERGFLFNQGLDLLKENIFFGYGFGVDYWTGKIINIMRTEFYHVHNGILNDLIQVGIFPVLFVTFILIARIKILKMNNIFIFFILYAIFRSYGESYYILNMGNIFSIIFLIIIFSKYDNTEIRNFRLRGRH